MLMKLFMLIHLSVVGSDNNELLIIASQTATLTGNGGNNRFVLPTSDTAITITITDFNVTYGFGEQDILDVSAWRHYFSSAQQFLAEMEQDGTDVVIQAERLHYAYKI